MITIREEQHQDIYAIREVNMQAFDQNQEADLVDNIRRSCDDMISLVAVVQNTIVGHICLSPATIESKAKKTIRGMGLAPMAVLPAVLFKEVKIPSQKIVSGSIDNLIL